MKKSNSDWISKYKYSMLYVYSIRYLQNCYLYYLITYTVLSNDKEWEILSAVSTCSLVTWTLKNTL